MSESGLPVPPRGLAARVGTVDGQDPLRFYVEEGRRLRSVIEELLPEDWCWEHKSVLDFGCGSARVLRHFAAEAANGEFWGCDIDSASIEWDKANLTPPFRFFQNSAAPPVSVSPGTLDLIWAMSVFTHITDLWSDWLHEMHRLLAPGGILIASFLGDGMWVPLVGEPYQEDAVGMAVLHHWEGPDAWVFHSEWWLRLHWGRAFDVLRVRRAPRTADGSAQVTHSYIAVRRRELDITTRELERIEPGEPREMAAMQTNLRLARREMATLAADAGRQRAAGVPTRLRRLLALRR